MAAPALFLTDNLLHPKEYGRGNEARQLAEIADHYTRWQFSHLLGFIAIMGFAVAVLGLAFLVRRHRPTAGLAGGALALLGVICFASVIALDGFTWGVLGEVSGRTGDTRVTSEALHEVQQSGWSLQYYAPALAWMVGMVLLAVSAARSGALPAPAAYLLALGSVLVGTEGLIVSNAYFIGGSAVMLAGGAVTAVAIARMGDGEWGGARRLASGDAPD